MAKKKATMTLKDFHGGSIPSDLPLPSAPGVIVRQPDRGSFDRQVPWGNPAGRSDHRLRPGSAGAVKNLEDRTPFFSNSAYIGRNFDEDERKPLDGGSAPRRTISDESIQALPSRVEPKMDHWAASRAAARPSSTPSSQYSSGAASGSYAGRFAEVNNAGVNSQNSGGNYQNVGGHSGQVASGSHPNAWGLRKEAITLKEPVSPALSAPDAALKLAHASALEKVSSGRWHSKQQLTPQIDVEVVRQPEPDRGSLHKGSGMYTKDAYHTTEVVGNVDHNDASLARHAGRSLAIDDRIHGPGKAPPAYERARSPAYMEAKERNISVNANSLQPPRGAGKLGNYESQPSVPSETTERPKLKLLPRSKPLEIVEPPVDYKQGFQQPGEPLLVEHDNISHETVNTVRTGVVGPHTVDQGVARPKLGLKPRSQALEPLEGSIESSRNSVFGGGRPREFVLKRRGIDDTAANNPEVMQPHRVKQEAPRTETVSHHAAGIRYDNRVENLPTDRRTAKNTDRRDPRNDVDRTDMQRKNWRNDNWRNNRENEKRNQQPQPQTQERPPSPETWRKPVEQPKLASPDGAPGLRYGKVASAVELAQAFSRSVSEPATTERFPAQRNLPGRGQIPFSRLTGPTPRPQINGY